MQSTTPLRVVSLVDPALDTEAMSRDDFIGYAQTRDWKLVKPKLDGRLCNFYIRRIPTSLYQRFVMEAASESDRKRRAFQCGVSRVEWLPTENGTLELIEPMQTTKLSSGELQIMSDAQMELFAPLYLEEIGEVANVRSFLPPGRELFFPVQGSLALVMQMRLSLDVAALQTRARESREQPKPDTVRAASDASEKPGDATATAEATSSSPASETTTSTAGERSSSSTQATSPPYVHGELSMIP